MVPMIRNILGGFLFSGDDVYKKAGVLSGGERTRLAVARMLLRPSNTLLLDEPTNHLDLDSKDVLLDALADFGGTLIFVSHDRYFVDRLATKIIAVGHGGIEVYPGTYAEYLWSKANREASPVFATSKPPSPKPPSLSPPSLSPPSLKPPSLQAPSLQAFPRPGRRPRRGPTPSRARPGARPKPATAGSWTSKRELPRRNSGFATSRRGWLLR